LHDFFTGASPSG